MKLPVDVDTLWFFVGDWCEAFICIIFIIFDETVRMFRFGKLNTTERT